jgi:ribonuclease D
MIPGTASDVALITQADDLLRMVEALSGESILAVDTESNSLHAYRERVCLIQFSTLQADYLVDPLALEDLSPLAPIFSNPSIEKVFHAAEYDLLCLRRDFGMEVANLFDTMIAGRILGYNEIGLGAMLEAGLGVKLDKRFQRANWGERPLPEHLIDYARLDTHYLIPLRDRLHAELVERGLLTLAQEDFRMAAGKLAANKLADNKSTSNLFANHTSAANTMAANSLTANALAANILANNQPAETGAYRNGAARVGERPSSVERPVDCWRISGAYDLPARQAAVLMELCRYRDEIARKLDRPLFKVFNDQTLLAIASELPGKLDELRELPGMSPNQIRRHGRALLRAVQRGLQAPPIYPVRQPRPDEHFTERLEALRTWRKNLAAEIGVGSDVILPRDLMITLAEKGASNATELAEVMEAAPWRLEHFGAQILEAMNKE